MSATTVNTEYPSIENSFGDTNEVFAASKIHRMRSNRRQSKGSACLGNESAYYPRYKNHELKRTFSGLPPPVNVCRALSWSMLYESRRSLVFNFLSSSST
jgi:hypothetical protein